MAEQVVDLSRRALIHRVGRLGGVSAAYRTMAAMGLLPIPAAYAGPPVLAPGQGKTVAIIGAGIAGMVAAWELSRAGYRCVVLEARNRPGGRNWTLRGGDLVVETDSFQQVSWDKAPHLYFNPGPGRIPYHHQGILSYCRDFGVEMEVMSNDNRAALLHDDAAFDGKPQIARRVVNDLRGYVAELAAKAVDRSALSAPVSEADLVQVRAMLRSFGALDRDMHYRGSSRAGYAQAPGGGLEAGTRLAPLDLRRLLEADFWRYKSQFGESWTMAATMMQPVGGMGRIGEAFGRKLGDMITYEAEITELRRDGDRARIVWRHASTKAAHVLEADMAICTIPAVLLKTVPSDFTPAVRSALAAIDYVPAGKVAFQAERRFWELDAQIYGGLSWTSRDITQIWYPSTGLQKRKGILVGAYIWSDKEGRAFAAKKLPQRLADALADGEHLHPGYGKDLRLGISVAWPKIRFSGAGWAEWSRAARTEAYPRLLAGDGPYLFAGEHMSHITGWQEGAVRSAHVAIGDVARRLAG